MAMERGQTRQGVLVTILLLLGVAYFGKQIVTFYYYSSEIQGWFDSQAKIAAHSTDDKIRKILWKQIQDAEIPVDNPDALRINRVGDSIVIEMHYQEVLYIQIGSWSKDLYIFEFHPRAERPLK